MLDRSGVRFLFHVLLTSALAVLSVHSMFSQNDSIKKHNTFKISKPKDSTYIKAFTNFYVYYDNPQNSLSYRDYVMRIQRFRASVSDRMIVTDARPVSTSNLPFDYTAFFKTNHFTKDIKMRQLETDTVRFLVFVTNKGDVSFYDLSKLDTISEIIYLTNTFNAKEFKQDVSHVRTKNAFNELIEAKWIPAQIKALKPHPSKRKNKYKISNAYSEGVLTIIYSYKPIEDT